MLQNSSAIDPYASPSEVPATDKVPRKACFARADTIAAAVCISLTIFMLQPFVGITYRKYYDNEPLQNPVRVVRSSASEIELADGRVVTEDFAFSDRLAWALKHTDKNVEIQPSASDPDRVEIYCKEFNFICGIGGPWYTIPLIPVHTKRYKRMHVGDGKLAPATELANK